MRRHFMTAIMLLAASCGEQSDDDDGETGTPVDLWCVCDPAAPDCAEGQACGVVCSGDAPCAPTAPRDTPVCHDACTVNGGACDCVPYTASVAGFCNPLNGCG